MKSTQQSLFKEPKFRVEHGGGQTRGHAKLRRPFLPKKWTHICLKSDKARGKFSFLAAKNKITIQLLIKKFCVRHHIEMGEFVVMRDHLHMKLKARRREDLSHFLRLCTTQLARLITGAKKGKPFGRFWEGLAYSRILTSAKEELYLRGYFQANRIEAEHGYAAREAFLQKFRSWVRSQGSKAKSAKPRSPRPQTTTVFI